MNRACFLLIPLLIAHSGAFASERPLRADESAAAAVGEMYREMLATWVVVDNGSDSALNIASPARPLDRAVEGFCVRDVIRLARDEKGHVEPLTHQLEIGADIDEAMAFQMYAFGENARACAKLPYSAFFRVQGALTYAFLTVLRGAWQREYLSARSKYSVVFEDPVADVCLRQREPATVLGAQELPSNADVFYYMVHFGGCTVDQKRYFVDLHAVYAPASGIVRGSARSIPDEQCETTDCGVPDDVDVVPLR